MTDKLRSVTLEFERPDHTRFQRVFEGPALDTILEIMSNGHEHIRIDGPSWWTPPGKIVEVPSADVPIFIGESLIVDVEEIKRRNAQMMEQNKPRLTVEVPRERFTQEDAEALLNQLDIEASGNMALAGGKYDLRAYGKANQASLRLLARFGRVTIGPEIDRWLYANLVPVESERPLHACGDPDCIVPHPAPHKLPPGRG